MDWLEKIPVDGKPRKISEWLTYLPEPDRTVAQKHCKWHELDEISMSEAILVAFTWGSTPITYKTGKKSKGYWEQQARWDKLYTMIINHEQKFLTTDEKAKK